MAKGLLKSGAKPARGGFRKGSGRKPDWLKAKCAELVDRNKLLEYLSRVASGEETEKVVVKSRETWELEEIPCSTKDRIHATEVLLERGFGKAVQGLEVAGADGGPVTWLIKVQGVTNA